MLRNKQAFISVYITFLNRVTYDITKGKSFN